LYIFNPPDRTFGEASPMPRQRYRHCGEIVNNQLWVLGGRNAMDEMIGEVDVSEGYSWLFHSLTFCSSTAMARLVHKVSQLTPQIPCRSTTS
jgi:hypothetical protein